MEIKLFEVRDIATFIPCIAIELSGHDGFLARRAGYGEPCVLFGRLEGGKFTYDPYDWGDRTTFNAHKFINENWDELETNAVIDVEFILGETGAKKKSERD